MVARPAQEEFMFSVLFSPILCPRERLGRAGHLPISKLFQRGRRSHGSSGKAILRMSFITNLLFIHS